MAIGRMSLRGSVVVARPATTTPVDVLVEPEHTRLQRAPARGYHMRASVVALISIVVVGAVLRGWGLGAHRLDFDEAFTAMAGRKHLGSLFAYLRVRDSHPPLDYLLRAPLARAGVDEILFRLPSVVCSIGALALFAWWMRNRGIGGIVATGLLAMSAFQVAHGREARMYAELEVIGVAAAVLADSWLRRPRSWHAPAIGGLALLGLLTHVSMFVLGAGLLVLAGRRTDREAWRWRLALAAAGLGWAVLWGSSFLVQSQGGHSSWIPSTSPSVVVDTFGGLAVSQPTLHLAALVAIAAGAVLLWRSDRWLGRVFGCCVLVPAVLATFAGFIAPVMLNRTFTLLAWGPCLAVGYLVAGLTHRSRILGTLAIGVLALVMIPAAVTTVDAPSSVDRALRHVEHVARPGDIVASHPAGRLHLLLWSMGVRKGEPSKPVPLLGLGNAAGVMLVNGPPTGRTWLLESTGPVSDAGKQRCASNRSYGSLHVVCLQGAVELDGHGR